jgi:hypothetical protein
MTSRRTSVGQMCIEYSSWKGSKTFPSEDKRSGGWSFPSCWEGRGYSRGDVGVENVAVVGGTTHPRKGTLSSTGSVCGIYRRLCLGVKFSCEELRIGTTIGKSVC